MRFLFRADAALDIGTGHVVRCATLANELVKQGHEVLFLCQERPGHLIDWLDAQGLAVARLAALSDRENEECDAALCRASIDVSHCDWLVVDHYALNEAWETAMAPLADSILAIDDLGRPHACDLLLDQNYPNPIHDLYRRKISVACDLLLGPHFALVRPEFAAMRPASLAKPRQRLCRLIVFMGGSDPLDETIKALKGVALARIPGLAVDAVIGASNPHRRAVERACEGLKDVNLHVQTPRMAELMASADCAINAGGSTTWERCTLGLPALVTIMAENQVQIAERVAEAGAHRLMGWYDELSPETYAEALTALTPDALAGMSKAAAELCDGDGTARVASRLVMERNDVRAYENSRHA